MKMPHRSPRLVWLFAAVQIIAGLFAPLVAAQTTYTWTGASSGNWGTAGNWNPSGVPGSSVDSDIVVFGASTRTTVFANNGVTGYDFNTLTFLTNAPGYTFNVAGAYGGLFIENGIVNQSRVTRPSFSIAANVALGIYGGALANSQITNSGEVVLSGSPSPSAGSAYIVNQNGGLIQFNVSNTPTAENATIVNNAGATVDVGAANIPQVTIGSLSGAGGVNLGSNTLIVGGLNNNDSISGVIAQTGALTKAGNGTLTLIGANTYAGMTTVQSGTLQIDGSLASSETLVDTGASLSGAGTIGNLAAQASSLILPGNANSNTTLSAGTLLCASSPVIQERIGDVGSSTHGTYLSLSQPLQTAFCPHLHFRFTSAGVPLTVGDYYLLVSILGATDYTTSNVDFDFNSFPGYPQATGNFFIGSLGSISTIYFQPTDLGDRIFANGFELFN
jgi:autotransporter-associated beta strand protein